MVKGYVTPLNLTKIVKKEINVFEQYSELTNVVRVFRCALSFDMSRQLIDVYSQQ
jgi:hypothetical protein